jgi:hypothetical protein
MPKGVPFEIKEPSAAVRALNPHVFGPTAAAGGPQRPVSASLPVKVAESSKRAVKMTRTEAQYEAMLRRENPDAQIQFERYTLKLANDCRYTPDFAVIRKAQHADVWMIEFHEVKGAFLFGGATKSATASSLTKPKLAAELFPWHRFFRATKDKEGNWTREEFKPL